MPLYFVIIVAIVILDQTVKHLIVGSIKLNDNISVVDGILSLAHIRNYGAAWSILLGQIWFFVIISTVSLGLMAFFFWKFRNRPLYLTGLSLMIGGTIGNFIDRLRLGYVVDMFQLDFINFPIFNVADCALTIGVAVILIAMLKDDKL
ncbi:signal peptidase II [Ligilactobacillus ruminis]|uniref:Lipoprotein signal peptidase n=1 Tax=Ligilactobacillus ruminis TaxID=1623 RepID=A0AAQ3ASZ6_9LACO|nr:signal peptidase II [Ligilactobacillus ruminis]WDC81835.1 signal peptidase II [Ligilactobacillus ruminis]